MLHHFSFTMDSTSVSSNIQKFTCISVPLVKDPVSAGNKVSKFMGVSEVFTERLLEQHKDELDGNPYEYIFDPNMPHMQAGKDLLREFYKPHVMDLY